MTRINLVPPSELTDQHLFAEFREIKMVPRALERSLKTKSIAQVLCSIPETFTLGTGHVKFFYNKGQYLKNRYEQLKDELRRRGYKFNEDSIFDPNNVFASRALNTEYTPTLADLRIIRLRIAEKIALKPNWYRKTVIG